MVVMSIMGNSRFFAATVNASPGNTGSVPVLPGGGTAGDGLTGVDLGGLLKKSAAAPEVKA
jgi:hypothetical protein